MTTRERERLTLDFGKPDRGSVEETFYPWDLTAQNFLDEGVPKTVIAEALHSSADYNHDPETYDCEKYFPVGWGKGIMDYEQYFGFDPVRRIHFVLPFRRFDERIVENTSNYRIRQDIFGRYNIKKVGSTVEIPWKQIVENEDDWKRLKEHGDRELERFFTDENLEKAYLPLKCEHEKGDFSLRLNLEGFFWTPRELLGDEEELIGFYAYPELIHDINDYILSVYQKYLLKVIKMLQPDVVYIMEDLSGRNGPMISSSMFDEFVGSYYKQLIPQMKELGTGNVFVDTDGQFEMLIPAFMEAGVDGFLPMDVNAGMDIVKIRNHFPTLKFIGGYNKLKIQEGKDAIDREFDRILPVVRKGGYIVGADHQIPPSVSVEQYRYYIRRLREVMSQCGSDI